MDELKRKEFTRIVNDWKARFPMLSKYSSSKLFMRADLFWIGLCFENDRWGEQEYRVFLEIRPLWTDASRINGSYIDYELKDEKGQQLFIEYSEHDNKFEYAVKCVKKQFGAIFENTINFSALSDLIKSYKTYNYIEKCNLIEIELAIAMYFDNLDMLEELKKSINYSCRFFNERIFKDLHRKTIEEWKTDLFSRFENRNAFMKQIELNVSIPKIARLKNSTIIYEPIYFKFRKPPKIIEWFFLQLCKLSDRGL